MPLLDGHFAINNSAIRHNGTKHINAVRELEGSISLTENNHLATQSVIYLNATHCIAYLDQTGRVILHLYEVTVVRAILTIREDYIERANLSLSRYGVDSIYLIRQILHIYYNRNIDRIVVASQGDDITVERATLYLQD